MILEALKEKAQTTGICAVDENGIMLSFKELDDRSDALAVYFLENLPKNASVLLIGDKDNDMLTCIFACMKSGRAYVPLAVNIPEKRAKFMADDSEAALIIAFSTELLSKSPLPRLTEKNIEEIIIAYDGKKVNREDWIKYDDMMALLYTSGSTGNPKGVINGLGDLENLFLATEDYYIGGPGQRVMNSFSYMFSAHMQHVFRTMVLMGSIMYAVPQSIQKDARKLMDYYLKIGPHYLGITPTSCAMLLSDSRFCDKEMPTLRGVALAGEVCSRKLVQRLFDAFPRLTVKIQYASTELTTVTIGNHFKLEEFRDMTSEVIPLGKPVESIEIKLWDEEDKEVLEGEKGELIILSPRLSDGYWKNPEQTNLSFFTLSDGRRGFRTRDLLVKKEGLLYYAGRLDNRIKIGGNRVELEEVESALTSLNIIRQCVVLPVESEDERVTSLIAYITLIDSSRNSLDVIILIKKLLKDFLPSYMIPQKIIILPEFKTNSSGKIDRGHLRQFHEDKIKKMQRV